MSQRLAQRTAFRTCILSPADIRHGKREFPFRLTYRTASVARPRLGDFSYKYAYLSNKASELGVHKALPPDSGTSKPAPREQEEITDQEWEIRTGRATDVLTHTLPEFFNTGLITSIDKSTGEPSLSSSPLPIVNINPLDLHAHPTNADIEPIYSPKIRLSYTPPAAMPTPLPKVWQVEGISLYVGSSGVVRHMMKTLYTDLYVVMNKVTVNTPGSSKSSNITPIPENHEEKPQRGRNKSVFIGLTVNGRSRVTGALSEWEVNSTYSFSPLTGLINIHTVDSILPAPHHTMYDSLRVALGKVLHLGLDGNAPGRPGAAGAAFEGSHVKAEMVAMPEQRQRQSMEGRS